MIAGGHGDRRAARVVGTREGWASRGPSVTVLRSRYRRSPGLANVSPRLRLARRRGARYDDR